MKNFGVFLNPQSKHIEQIASILTHLVAKNGITFFKLKEQANLLPDFVEVFKDNQTKLDCILTFGGDGTFLRAVNFSLSTETPLLGVNLGKLGFLSDTSLTELENSIVDLMKRKFKVQERMMLKVTVKRESETIITGTALNDVVIHRGFTPSLIDIDLSANRRFVVQTRCDGIIVSTPTGSTAYSLSAGGPIISPVMDAIVITPLNPHVLTVRPMVFSANDTLQLKILNSESTSLLQLDGRNIHDLKVGDKVTVSSATEKVKFIKLSNKTFYQILRKKFHMGKQ